MIKMLRGGGGSGDFVQEWVNVRAGVYESGVGRMNDGLVWEWFVKRQLWCLRELVNGLREDEDEDGFCDFDGGGTDEGSRGWREGIETNGICCLLWRGRGEMWKALEEME